MKVRRNKYKPLDNKKDKVDLSLIDKKLKKYKSDRSNIIPILQDIQDVYGYINKDVVIYVANKLEISKSYFWEVATFYSQFKLEQRGKNIIKICQGTACHVQNSKSLLNALSNHLDIKEGETTDDKMFTLESVACVGCCSLAPVIVVGDDVYGKLNDKKAVRLINNIKTKNKPDKNE